MNIKTNIEENKEKTIRILCVFSMLDYGGAETMWMNLYRHIDRNVVQFDFIKHTKEKYSYENEILSLGGKIYEAPRFNVINYIEYVQWWETFFKEHSEYKIIHGHYFTISAIYFRIAKKYRLITVGHSHGTHLDGNIVRQILLKLLVSKVEKYSDYKFACSNEAGKFLFPSGNYKVLRNAIDIDKFKYNAEIRRNVRRKNNLEDSFVIGTVGRIVYQKNPYGILDIFNQIFLINSKAKLLWIGSGHMKEEVENRIEQLNLNEKIIFLENRNDVNKLLQAMDVYIMPSFNEGLPVSAIEAQASGLSCFLSNKISSEVKISENCYLLPITDTKKWALEICKCENLERKTLDDIRINKYDVKKTAQYIKDFYLNLYK